jgi:hypothetical protein
MKSCLIMEEEKWYVILLPTNNGLRLAINMYPMESIAGPFESDDEANIVCEKLSQKMGIPTFNLADVWTGEMQDIKPSQNLFQPGRVFLTPGAKDALVEAGELPSKYLVRHLAGDWGEIPPEDAKENELSVREGYRILSAYGLKTGTKIWIITEADRSSTTILLPEEY